MKNYNVISVKIKTVNKEGALRSTDWMVYKIEIQTYNGPKKVSKPKLFAARNPKNLMRILMNEMSYRAERNYYYVMQIKTTKGQFYFSNCK